MNKWIIAGVIIILLIVGGLIYANINSEDSANDNSNNQQQELNTEDYTNLDSSDSVLNEIDSSIELID